VNICDVVLCAVKPCAVPCAVRAMCRVLCRAAVKMCVPCGQVSGITVCCVLVCQVAALPGQVSRMRVMRRAVRYMPVMCCVM
jgi:hypothetical protein